MSDLLLVVEFIFNVFRSLGVLYSSYFILACAFGIFMLSKVVDLLIYNLKK